MRKWQIAVMIGGSLLAAGTQAVSQQDEGSAACQAMKSSAESIMLMHQQGIPQEDQVDGYKRLLGRQQLNKAQKQAYGQFKKGLRQTYDMEDAQAAVEKMVAQAYDQPRHEHKGDRQAAVDKFAQQIEKRCQAAQESQ